MNRQTFVRSLEVMPEHIQKIFKIEFFKKSWYPIFIVTQLYVFAKYYMEKKSKYVTKSKLVLYFLVWLWWCSIFTVLPFIESHCCHLLPSGG